MRKRQEIKDSLEQNSILSNNPETMYNKINRELINIEVLLDIRDLLIEIRNDNKKIAL